MFERLTNIECLIKRGEKVSHFFRIILFFSRFYRNLILKKANLEIGIIYTGYYIKS